MSWTRITLLSSGFLLLGAAQSLGANDLTPVERVWYAQGLTHPMVVHIPIALLLSAAIAAILRVVFRSIPVSVVYYCLLIGTLGAIPSVIAGWAWAPQEDSAYINPFDADSGIFWHRWGGIAVTLIGLLILSWATRQVHKKVRYEKKLALTNAEGTQVGEVKQTTTVQPMPAPSQFGWQFCTVLLSVAMGWVAHTGGEQVYPDNFGNIVRLATGEELPAHIEKERKRQARDAAASKDTVTVSTAATQPAVDIKASTQPVDGSPVSSAAKIDFAKQVWPIFEEKCIYCHGEEKNKGRLRMHTEEKSLAGGSEGPLYIKGNADESMLITSIISDDEDVVMPPPDENKKVTDEELRILRQWVNEGAVWNKPETAAPAQ